MLSTLASRGPIKRTSLADAVYETLLEAILRGQLQPGAELSAVALAQQLEVSRTPVTEALQRLTHDGLVEQTNHHQPRVVTLSRKDVTEIYELRKQLEGAAAEYAATRISEEVLRDLRQKATRLAAAHSAVDWPTQAIDFDLHFHDCLAAASGNRRLSEDIARYRRLVRCFCRMTGNDANLQAAFQEHLAILDALENRKPVAARKAMVNHISRRLQVVLNSLFPPASQ
jgi:DNA-binding GntR family transcriptional regulator